MGEAGVGVGVGGGWWIVCTQSCPSLHGPGQQARRRRFVDGMLCSIKYGRNRWANGCNPVSGADGEGRGGTTKTREGRQERNKAGGWARRGRRSRRSRRKRTTATTTTMRTRPRRPAGVVGMLAACRPGGARAGWGDCNCRREHACGQAACGWAGAGVGVGAGAGAGMAWGRRWVVIKHNSRLRDGAHAREVPGMSLGAGPEAAAASDINRAPLGPPHPLHPPRPPQPRPGVPQRKAAAQKREGAARHAPAALCRVGTKRGRAVKGSERAPPRSTGDGAALLRDARARASLRGPWR
jgi:hypothetical protein